jgi:hypothetical protein
MKLIRPSARPTSAPRFPHSVLLACGSGSKQRLTRKRLSLLRSVRLSHSAIPSTRNLTWTRSPGSPTSGTEPSRHCGSLRFLDFVALDSIGFHSITLHVISFLCTAFHGSPVLSIQFNGILLHRLRWNVVLRLSPASLNSVRQCDFT